MANRIIWGADLYKGFKFKQNTLLGGPIDDILPFQMLTLDQKNEDWVHAVADFYEVAGWNNVERKAWRLQRNYRMRNGQLNQSDYIINPTPEQFFETVGLWTNNTETSSPLEQFYSLAPTFVDVLRGEFIKRDNRWTIETIDPWSVNEAFKEKEEGFRDAITQIAMLQQQQTLADMGLSPEVDREQYESQMQMAMQRFSEVELKSKSFRTTGAKWAEKVIKVHEKRYDLHEIEPDAFESGLITDSEFWHLDLLDDDFKIELLNPIYCDYFKGPNVKYVSQGDYFLWFDFGSAGDIVNKFGRRMKEADILKLKEIYITSAASNIIVPDYLKSQQGAYYDLSKPWSQATALDPKMNDTLLGKELAYNYTRNPNFDHNMEVDILNPVWGRRVTGHPNMFRIIRLYWRSMRRVGWLTKVNRDGTVEQPDWVDENYKVTVEPVYDQSIVKEKTKDNLLYGEHIDWTWAPEWRHIIKISPNQKHTFWLNENNTFESIYIDGGPVKFQFKGRNNPFDSLPPVEGCNFSWINTGNNSFIDRLRSLQILYNICMNKVPKKFLEDKGLKVAVDERTFSTNTSSNQVNGLSPREEYEERLNDSALLTYRIDRTALEGMGQPALPEVLNMSTAQEALFYLDAADRIKWMAGEQVGITRQRVGAQKASETATGIQQGINYSETQTEKYFEQHQNLMQRVRQRMLDAAQFYSTFSESNRDMYMNEMDETIALNIEGMDNMFTHYNIYLQSRSNVRNALQNISKFLMEDNTLPITPSAKIEALVEGSVPKILNLLKTSELEQVQRELQEAEAQRQADREKIQAQQQMQAQEQAHEDQQNALDRQTDIQVAAIRALGGRENTVEADLPDVQGQLDSLFKKQELADKKQIAQDQLKVKKEIDTQKMLIEREKAAAEVEKAKVQGEYALKVAKENTRKKG